MKDWTPEHWENLRTTALDLDRLIKTPMPQNSAWCKMIRMKLRVIADFHESLDPKKETE